MVRTLKLSQFLIKKECTSIKKIDIKSFGCKASRQYLMGSLFWFLSSIRVHPFCYLIYVVFVVCVFCKTAIKVLCEEEATTI